MTSTNPRSVSPLPEGRADGRASGQDGRQAALAAALLAEVRERLGNYADLQREDRYEGYSQQWVDAVHWCAADLTEILSGTPAATASRPAAPRPSDKWIRENAIPAAVRDRASAGRAVGVQPEPAEGCADVPPFSMERMVAQFAVPVVHPEPGDRPMWIEAAAQAIYDHEYDEDQERCACGFDTDGDQARHQAEIAVAAAEQKHADHMHRCAAFVCDITPRALKAEGQVAAIRALCDEAERDKLRPVAHGGKPFPSLIHVDRIRAALVASSATTPEADS